MSDDTGTNVSQGSAYIFVRNGTNWTQQQKISASDGAALDNFGYAVAISSNTVIVSANRDNVAVADQGSAYIFVRDGVVWTEQQKLTANDGAVNDQFGISVGLDGETAIIGAYLDDFPGTHTQGSAYVFARNGTTWTQQQKLVASDGTTTDYFGNFVAISGDTVIVAAPSDDFGTNIGLGSAYVFVRNGTTWAEQQKLFASDGDWNEFFGSGVGISGDIAVVTAQYDYHPELESSGSAYIFTRNGTTWSAQPKFTRPTGTTTDDFGLGVGIFGETIVLGAPLEDQGRGAVHILQGSMTNEPAIHILSVTKTGDNFVFLGAGIPNGAHRIQSTEELSQGFNPAAIGTATADSNGNFQFTNAIILPQRFYRAVFP